jgi:TctA family transporter
MFEMALRQTMLMFKSDLSVLFTTPIPLVFMLLTVFFVYKFGFAPQKKKPVAAKETPAAAE